MKIDQLPKILFLHEQSQQMQDRRIRSKVEYDTTSDKPRKVVKKKINNTIQITQKLVGNNQINCLHYSNKLGLLVTFLEEEVLFTDLQKLETYFTTPQTKAKSLKEISGYIKFCGKGYMSSCQTKILLVNFQMFIYFDLIDMTGTSIGKNEHGLRHIMIINEKSFVGWNFQQKPYLYTIETGQIPSGKPFDNISCCASVNLINKNIFICEKLKEDNDQSTHIMIYSQNGQKLINEVDLIKYQNYDNYLFNYTFILSVFQIRRQKQGEYSDNDIYGLVLGYYDDLQEEPDRRYLNFLRGNMVKKDNDDIQIRGFELFQSPNQDRSFYYDQNQNKIPFEVQVLNNRDMKLIMIQKLQVVYVVDSTLPFDRLNLYSMNPVQQIKLQGGKFFNGISLMKNMLQKQRIPPIQDSNETCNMICRDFNGQFLSLYFPAKETELTVPFPATSLVLGNKKIERRYAVSTIQQVQQYQVDNIKEGISKIKKSKYIESITNHVKVDAFKKYSMQQKSMKKNKPQGVNKQTIQKSSQQQKQTKKDSTNVGGFSLLVQPSKPASKSIFDIKPSQNIPTKQDGKKADKNTFFSNSDPSNTSQAIKGPSVSIFDKKQQPKQGNQSKQNSLFGNNNQGAYLFGSGNTSTLGGLFGDKSTSQGPKQTGQFKPNGLFGSLIANPNEQKKPFQNLLGSNAITPGSNILSSKQTPGGPAVTNNLFNKDDKNKIQPPAKQETKIQDKKQSSLFGDLSGLPQGSNTTTGGLLFGPNKTQVKKQQSKQKQSSKQKTDPKQSKQANKQNVSPFSNLLNQNNNQSELFKNMQNSAKQTKTNDLVKKEQKKQGTKSVLDQKTILTNPTDYNSRDKANNSSKTKIVEASTPKVSQKSQKIQQIQTKPAAKGQLSIKQQQPSFTLSKLSTVQQEPTQLNNEQKLKYLASILGFPCVQSLSQPLKMLTIQQIDALIPSLKSISKVQPKKQNSPQLSQQQKARTKLLKQQYFTPLIKTFDSIKKYINNAKQQNTYESMNMFSLKNCKLLLIQLQQKKPKQNKLNSLNPLLSVVRNYTKRMQFLQGQYKIIDLKLLQNHDPNNRDKKSFQYQRKKSFLEKQILECQRKCSTILYYKDSVNPQKQNQDILKKLFMNDRNKNHKIQNTQDMLQYFQYKMVNILKQKSSKCTSLMTQIQKQLQQIDQVFQLDDNQQGSRNKFMKKSSSKLLNNLLNSSMISNASSLSKKKKGLFKFNIQNNTSSSSDDSDRQKLPNVLPLKYLYEPESQRRHILIKFTQKPIDIKQQLKRITPLVKLQQDYQEPQLKYPQAQTRNVSQLFKGIGGLKNMQSSSIRKSVNFKEKIPIKKEDLEKQILTKVKQVDHSEIDASQEKERQRHRLRSFRGSSDEDQARQSDEGSLEDVDAPQIIDRNISFAPQKMKTLNENKMSQLGKNGGLKMKQTQQIDIAEKGKQVEKKQKSSGGFFGSDNKSGALSFELSGKAGLFDGNNKPGEKQAEKKTKPQQKKLKQGAKQASKASLFGDPSLGGGTLSGAKKQEVNIKPKIQEKPSSKQDLKKKPQAPKSLFGTNNTASPFGINNTGSLFGAKDQKKQEKKQTAKQKQQGMPTGSLFGGNKTLLNNIVRQKQQKQSQTQTQAKKGAFGAFTGKKTSQQPSMSLFGDKNKQQKPSLFTKAKQLQKQIQKKQKQCENLKDKSKPVVQPQNKKDNLKEQLANQINKIGNLTTEIKENVADNNNNAKLKGVFGNNNVAPQPVANTGVFGNQQKTQLFGQANTVTHQVPKFGAQNKFMVQQSNQTNQQGGDKVFNPNAGSFGDGFSQPQTGGLKSFSSFAPQTGGNSLFGGNQGQQNIQTNTNQINAFGNNQNTNTMAFGSNTQVSGQPSSLFGQSTALYGSNPNSMFNQNQNSGSSLFGSLQQHNQSMNTGGFLSGFNPTGNQQQAPTGNQSAMMKPRK